MQALGQLKPGMYHQAYSMLRTDIAGVRGRLVDDCDRACVVTSAPPPHPPPPIATAYTPRYHISASGGRAAITRCPERPGGLPERAAVCQGQHSRVRELVADATVCSVLSEMPSACVLPHGFVHLSAAAFFFSSFFLVLLCTWFNRWLCCYVHKVVENAENQLCDKVLRDKIWPNTRATTSH